VARAAAVAQLLHTGFCERLDASLAQLALVSVWIVFFAWAFLPQKLLLVLTFPLLLAGLVVVGADLLFGVDLIELVTVWHTFHLGEVIAAVQPYVWTIAVAIFAIAALAALLWSPPDSPTRPAVRIGLVIFGLLLAIALPSASWRGAWPVALAGAVVEGSLGNAGIELPDRPNVRASPRNRFDNWQAKRESPPLTPETYVFVIGESVRADRLPACGGRPQITAAPREAIVFCDVISGSSSTHTSVPLLVSRDLPGHNERVPHDATFLKAFEAAGFETFWFGVQERSIAWPDARNQVYESVPQLDRTALLPLLDQALAKPSQRKIIVLHAYNVHAPYRERYKPENAPFAVDPAKATGGVPERASIDQWWNDYDNAVDETMRLLEDVTARLQSQTGAAVVMFTPDHAENLLDDARGLRFHALKMPTIWDTSVPGVIWANATWRDANPEKWKTLEANRVAPLMHMDFVPTLLGAANVRYRETRSQPVDLTAGPVPPRTRFTQVRAGETVNVDQLRAQAECNRPGTTKIPGC